MLFSVIVPVFNSEKYLKDCIDSVLKQSCQDFELVLVDDGSTDSSLSICQEYALQQPDRIKIFSKTNEGQFLTRRKGLDIASGDFVIWLDSDDFICINALSNLKKIIEETAPQMIVYQWMRTKANGTITKSISKKFFNEGLITRENLMKVFLETPDLNSLCLKACKREMYFENYKYESFVNVKSGEDLLQSLLLMSNLKKIYYLPKALYYYRNNPSSVIGQGNKFDYLSIDIVAKALYDTMCLIDQKDEENEALLYKYVLKKCFINIVLFDNDSENVRFEVYSKIYSYHYVQKASSYVKKYDVFLLKRLALVLFYKKYWHILHFEILVIRFLIKIRVMQKKVWNFLRLTLHL